MQACGRTPNSASTSVTSAPSHTWDKMKSLARLRLRRRPTIASLRQIATAGGRSPGRAAPAPGDRRGPATDPCPDSGCLLPERRMRACRRPRAVSASTRHPSRKPPCPRPPASVRAAARRRARGSRPRTASVGAPAPSMLDSCQAVRASIAGSHPRSSCAANWRTASSRDARSLRRRSTRCSWLGSLPVEYTGTDPLRLTSFPRGWHARRIRRPPSRRPQPLAAAGLGHAAMGAPCHRPRREAPALRGCRLGRPRRATEAGPGAAGTSSP